MFGQNKKDIIQRLNIQKINLKKYLNYFIKREMKVNLQTNVTIYNTKKK